jgi:malonyl-CoA O-methyltransferase
MPRRAVRASFNRAAGSYDAAAALQRRVCELLLAALDEPAPTRVLDAGCGTGYGRSVLAHRWPGLQVTAADFAPAMLAAAGGGICADIEALPLRADCFDLYWSSLTVQWCDPVRVAAEAARVLKPGGRLAISSLGPGTLRELDQAFAGRDAHRHVLEFSPANDLAAACRAAGMDEVRLEQRPLRMHHENLASLLRELKALGANQVGGRRRPGLMGRAAWRAVEARYEALREPAGLPATFEVILCTARKAI